MAPAPGLVVVEVDDEVVQALGGIDGVHHHVDGAPDPRLDTRRDPAPVGHGLLPQITRIVDGGAQGGEAVVAAMFVIPYPPGFPILVPGQVVSRAILDYMGALDVKEIHGYRPELGLRVFTIEALETEIDETKRAAE